MEKDVLEIVMNKSFDDSKIKRIIDVKCESALPKGENFLSTILRVTAKAVLGNGRISEKSLIAKKEDTEGGVQQLNNDLRLFRTEVSIYTHVIKEMEYLMEEFGDTEGPLWCKFIHYILPDSIIILEDLKALGFYTVKRTEVQDLEHARLVLRNLGRYHAMAKILEERGLVSKDDYVKYIFIYDEVSVRNICYGGLKALAKGMRTWGEEWAEQADKLNKVTFEEYLKHINECGNFDENSFKCLNHGDCWNNNMMFKNNWEGRPIEMRFVDFQLAHYDSPCIDVVNFIYRSVKPNVRHQNFNSLIELYHQSLISTLEKFGYKESKPSLEDIKGDMERLKFFGLSFFTAFYPCGITERTDAFDLDLIVKTNGEEGYNISVYSEDGVIEKIEADLKELLKYFEN